MPDLLSKKQDLELIIPFLNKKISLIKTENKYWWTNNEK